MPGASACIDMPEDSITREIDNDGELILTVSLRTIDSTSWAKAGFEIAWSQFLVGVDPLPDAVPCQALVYPKIKDTQITISVSNSTFTFEFEKASASISKWTVRGNDVFDASQGLQLTFWRAPTDNDIPKDAIMWKLFGVDAMQKQIRSVKYNLDDHGIFRIVVQSYHSPPILAWGFDATTTYTIHGDGDIQIHVHAEPHGAMPTVIPRFGLEMSMSKTMNVVTWYGRGPGESYSDKKEAARLGIWNKTIDEMPFNYEFPQENGNRTDTRWVHLLDNQGVGMRATLTCVKPAQEEGFDFNVQRFNALEIETAKHPYELGKSDRVLFRIDGGHHGLGTASCGPGVLEKYRLACQTFDFTVNLSGVRR